MPSIDRTLHAMREAVPRLVIVPVLLIAWEAAVRLGVIDARQFPAPSRIAEVLVRLFEVGFPAGVLATSHVWASVIRIGGGFGLAVLVGVPLGLLIGTSRPLTRTLEPLVSFARSIAALALLPLFVAWFGVGELTRILLVFYAAFWIVLVNTIAAVQGVDPVFKQAARSLGATRLKIFFGVTLMAALPRIFTGIKTALGIAFLVIVAVEMVGTEVGLGALISQARTFFRSDIAIAGMLMIGLIGYLISVGMDVLENVLLPWRSEKRSR